MEIRQNNEDRWDYRWNLVVNDREVDRIAWEIRSVVRQSRLVDNNWQEWDMGIPFFDY